MALPFLNSQFYMLMKSKKYSKNTQKNNSRAPIILLVCVAAVALAVGGWYFFYRDSAQQTDNVTTPANDPNFDQGGERNPTTESVPRDGGVVDTSGEDSQNDNANSSVSSKSGKITVFQPAKNATLHSGATLSGTAKINTVSYRLIDDKVGVIGSGSLKVKNGKFSGRFSFNSNGSEGRLDIFNQLEDGREVDVIEIPVRFK